MDAIKQLLECNKKKRITISVVGDFLVDQYFQTKADKISPEFPIVRILSEDEKCKVMCGGAGNVAIQPKNFNVDVNLFSFLDEYSRSVVESSGLLAHNCVMLPKECRAPIKKRLYDDDFPLCRWDIEGPLYGFGDTKGGRIALEQCQRALCDKFLLTHNDVVILSDYDKGVFHANKKRWLRDDFLTIVDPKKGPVEDWEGCYIFKPNNQEAKELSGGLTKWQEQCKYFKMMLKCKAVIITQGADGVVGIIDNNFFEYRPSKKTVAISVIGAGDCFNFVLAMALAHKIDIETAVQLAFEAGVVYVQKAHNEPIFPHELLAAIDPVGCKYVTLDFLRNRPQGQRLVVTNGCYDLMHIGHISTFEYARSKGDKLAVLVNTDKSVSGLKGEDRPIIPLEQRMKMIASLYCVDYVVPFDTETPDPCFDIIKPDFLVKGQQWEGSMNKPDSVGELLFSPMIDNISTSIIVSKIK